MGVMDTLKGWWRKLKWGVSLLCSVSCLWALWPLLTAGVATASRLRGAAAAATGAAVMANAPVYSGYGGAAAAGGYGGAAGLGAGGYGGAAAAGGYGGAAAAGGYGGAAAMM